MAIEVVVDSSVIVALVTPEEHSEWASKKISEHNYFHILDLNYYEVSNAIKSKTSGKFEGNDAVKAFTEAVKLMNLYAIHSFSEIIADAIALSFKLDVTVYDAAFLSLAEKLDIRLLTLDIRLKDKIKGTKYYGIIECPSK
ncbi:MAG: type II toxin-antitoxin system VapC family toxin [Candidatus Micrarchaeales archaeon]|jgi:predicted nucleic acid-binding protein